MKRMDRCWRSEWRQQMNKRPVENATTKVSEGEKQIDGSVLVIGGQRDIGGHKRNISQRDVHAIAKVDIYAGTGKGRPCHCHGGVSSP